LALNSERLPELEIVEVGDCRSWRLLKIRRFSVEKNSREPAI